MKKNKCTKNEIEGQPKLWKSVFDFLALRQAGLQDFLIPILEKPGLQIVLTGAGSSAFIGEVAQGVLQVATGHLTRAVPTTDIVTHPQLFLPIDQPLLLISFARSGNSPESVEAIKLVDDFAGEVYHLIISCNDQGALVKYARNHSQKAYALVLPEETHDKSLAMTGSFTSMLLTVLLIFRNESLSVSEKAIKTISEYGTEILNKQHLIASIASKNFERVVFLGSGPMLGIARECHLKLQELTDGQIICKYDSFLGFRHGPRAVINPQTLMVYFFSQDDHVYRYEQDLAVSISKDGTNCISVGRILEEQLDPLLNINFGLVPKNFEGLEMIPFTLVGQLLGMYKSLELGLNPDNPSVSGAISRVVEGVVIYEYPKKIET